MSLPFAPSSARIVQVFGSTEVPDLAHLVVQVRDVAAALGRFDAAGPTSGEGGAALLALVAELETLKCAAEGAQVVATVQFDAAQRRRQAAAGVAVDRLGRGVGLQVGLARRESHHRGALHLGLARTLASELPGTLAALRRGRISEWRATLVARETACLSREHRAQVDDLVDQGDALGGLGERELVAQVRRLAARLDPASVAARRRRAESERCVSLRPAPDAMTYLTALLPVREGVGVYAALRRAADAARCEADPRSSGQVMADQLVTSVLGQPDGVRPVAGVTVNVVVSDKVLLGLCDDPAEVDGYGPVPGALARDWATAGPDAHVELRRLYASPAAGALVAMDSRARCFPDALATVIRLRDRTCRTPWCDAPVRHVDHICAHADRGPTSAENGQGLCQACNHAKQATGWRQRTVPGQRHTVLTMTPTGTTYRATAPPCPQPAAHPARVTPGRAPGSSAVESALERLLQAA